MGGKCVINMFIKSIGKRKEAAIKRSYQCECELSVTKTNNSKIWFWFWNKLMEKILNSLKWKFIHWMEWWNWCYERWVCKRMKWILCVNWIWWENFNLMRDAYVPYVAYVLTCLRAFVPLLLTCLHFFTCLTCLHFLRALYVPSFSYVPYVPSFFTCLIRAFIFLSALLAFIFCVPYVPSFFYVLYVLSFFYVSYVLSIFYVPSRALRAFIFYMLIFFLCIC